jgi:hypothetical protein
MKFARQILVHKPRILNFNGICRPIREIKHADRHRIISVHSCRAFWTKNAFKKNEFKEIIIHLSSQLFLLGVNPSGDEPEFSSCGKSHGWEYFGDTQQIQSAYIHAYIHTYIHTYKHTYRVPKVMCNSLIRSVTLKGLYEI